MGPKKKEKDKGKKSKKDKDKNKQKKEEPKEPDVETQPLPDYDWLPKKRNPKEMEILKVPIDDGLWLWPGERKMKPHCSETFWANGKPPTPPMQLIEKPLQERDKDLIFTKESPFIKVKPTNAKPNKTPPCEIQHPNETAWCDAKCPLIEQNTMAECEQHGHMKPAICVEVEIIEKNNKGDILNTEVQVPCGDGLQSLRWLGHTACTQMAFIKNEAPQKFLPQSIKSMDGHVLDVDTPIREVLRDLSHVTIDCSSGPLAYGKYWDGRPPMPTEKESIMNYFKSRPNLPILVDTPPPKPPPPPKKKKKKKGEVDLPSPIDPNNLPTSSFEPPPLICFEAEVQTPTDIVTFIDWQAYDIPDLLVEIKGNTNEEMFKVEWMVALEMMTAYSGAIEAMLLWFGGQGVELEDKDFCCLNHEQFQKLFNDMKLSPKPFTENKLREYFEKYGIVNNITGAYQLSIWGFFPTLLHLFHFSGLYEKFGIYYQANPPVPLHEKIWHFLTIVLLSNFSTQVKPKLDDFHSAEIIDSLAILKEHEDNAGASLLKVNPEYVEPIPIRKLEIDRNASYQESPDLSNPEAKNVALEAAILKHEQEEHELSKTSDNQDAPIVFFNVWTQVDMEVDVKIIMPHFKKWLVFGDHWDTFLAAAITIYALQKSTDVLDFTVKEHRLRFGVEEIQRFLLAASHCLYNKQCKPLLRVSKHSFLQTYLQDIFVKAKVAKPLYTTYKEKLEYLRLQCFRHEEPLPPIPKKKKGSM